MSWHMNVKVDDLVDDGDYEAVLDQIDQIITNFQGEEKERLKWVFRIPDKDDVEIVGFTSMSPSTRAKAYQWAEVLMGDINPKIGWGLRTSRAGGAASSLAPPRTRRGARRTGSRRS